jgi:hypothetical protein
MPRKSQLPNDQVELSVKALLSGLKIKLSSITLRPVPTPEEIANEAALWEVADEIEQTK